MGTDVSESPCENAADVAAHIVGVITAAVGIFFIFFVEEIIARQRQLQCLTRGELPVDAGLEAEQMVGRRGEVDKVGGRIEARLLGHVAMRKAGMGREDGFLLRLPGERVG